MIWLLEKLFMAVWKATAAVGSAVGCRGLHDWGPYGNLTVCSRCGKVLTGGWIK